MTASAAIAGAIALSHALTAGNARADALTIEESGRLARGETVSRLQTTERNDHRYVGGVTYTVIDSSPDEMASLLDDVSSYRHLLPKTKSARLVGTKSGDALIELRQGNAVFETSYTVRVHREPSSGDASGRSATVRFWLDPSQPHGIDDAWGFFRVDVLPEPGKVLLTYGVLVDMGEGIGRMLFEEKVRGLMLSVPQLVRGYLVRRHARTPWRVTQR